LKSSPTMNTVEMLRNKESVCDAMTFRDMTFQDDLAAASAQGAVDVEKSFFQSLVDNQSPIIKIWFVMMVLNLGLFLFLIHS
jgi:hypothetical protein